MKIKIILLAASLVVVSVMARIIAPFHGWDNLTETSPDIIVVQCGKPTPPNPNVIIMDGTKSDSEIQIISVLKCTNDLSSARLQTDHDLRQGEDYLVFGYFDGGICKAYEEYRVVPLGVNFSTNSIAGKTLNEQIQILLQSAINNLGNEIQKNEEEKERLEESVER
ncbi:MAG TPA: hypothetical protein VIK35_08495 [Verrucomicrobiae bacterium]